MKRSRLDLLIPPAWIAGGLLILMVTAAPIVLALGAWRSGWAVLNSNGASLPYWSWGSVPTILMSTLLWVTAIMAGAMVIGVPTGIALGRMTGAGTTVLRTACVAVLCIPPYLLYWIWGLPVGGQTALVQWFAASPQRAQALQMWQLWWGLVWWTWPFVALPVAWAVTRMDERAIEAMRLDGASRFRIFLAVVRNVRSSIALGAGLATLFTLTSFAAFDLASTTLPIADSFDSILRRIRFELGPPAALAAATPLLLVHGLVALVIWRLLHKRDPRAQCSTRQRAGTGHVLVVVGVLLVSLLLPIGILVWRLDGVEPLAQLGALEGEAMMHSAVWAATAGMIVGLLTALFALCFLDDRRWIRIPGAIGAGLLVILAVLPATTRGSLMVQASTTLGVISNAWFGVSSWQMLRLELPGRLSLSLPLTVLVGYVATFGFLAVFVARWLAETESTYRRDLRRLDGATRPAGVWRSTGSAITSASVATGLLTLALALGEVSTTMILLPPGAPSLTQRLLNKMHYAYEDSAIATCLVMLAIILPVAILASLALRRASDQLQMRRLAATSLTAVLAFSLFLMPGCKEESATAPVASVDFMFVKQIGSVGRAEGQFIAPRAVAFDPINRLVSIIDRSGRIQRFTPEGDLDRIIALPAYAQGFPTGASVHPVTGDLYVADTHEHRILIFDPTGRAIDSFGTQGTDAGQFIYPTDVAFGPDGMIYVSEYGGNDRIQVFDSDHRFLFAFGTQGHGDGQFNRPQSIRYNPRRDEFIILDACNHRVVFTDPKGNWIDVVASPGSNAGQLNYPYDCVLLQDDSMIITEFGGGRLQRLARDGAPMGTFGERGDGPGQFVNPWGIAAVGNTLFVADGANNRVSVITFTP